MLKRTYEKQPEITDCSKVPALDPDDYPDTRNEYYVYHVKSWSVARDGLKVKLTFKLCNPSQGDNDLGDYVIDNVLDRNKAWWHYPSTIADFRHQADDSFVNYSVGNLLVHALHVRSVGLKKSDVKWPSGGGGVGGAAVLAQTVAGMTTQAEAIKILALQVARVSEHLLDQFEKSRKSEDEP